MNVSRVKRFMELFDGDIAFRAAVVAGMGVPPGQFGIDIDATSLRCLWDADASDAPQSAVVEAYRHARNRDLGAGRRSASRLEQRNPAYASWRSRQLGRCLTQTNPTRWHLPHYPYAIELSDGCSIGCHYCCFDAPPVRAVARYTAENARLYRGILEALAAFFGPGTETGFLYWATDPLDNRDYERYLGSFRDVFGVPPRTTTAAWHRDLERSRALIRTCRREDGVSNLRFSINSLAQLHECLEAFSPDELAEVPLVLQNPESTTVRVASGRAADDSGAAVDTNANVSGVLVNLVRRDMRLISPTSDLARWPLGYRLHDQASFDDEIDFLTVLGHWQREWMVERFDEAFVPRLREDLLLEARADRVVLSTSFTASTYEDALSLDVLRAIDGSRSVARIREALSGRHPADAIVGRLHGLYRGGLFEEARSEAAPGLLASRTRSDEAAVQLEIVRSPRR